MKRGDLSKQPQHSAPLSIFPSRVCLDEQGIGDNCAKSAECRNKSELPEFFAKIEVKFDAAEMFLPVKGRKIAFDRQLKQTQYDQHPRRDQASRHNSFP